MSEIDTEVFGSGSSTGYVTNSDVKLVKGLRRIETSMIMHMMITFLTEIIKECR